MKWFIGALVLQFSLATTASAQYVLRSISANCGGRPMASAIHRHHGSAGQLAAGRMSGGAFEASAGFWNSGYGPVSAVEPPLELEPPLHSFLERNAPNPTRPHTEIHFQVGAQPGPGWATQSVPCRLTVIDVHGRVVRTLLSAPRLPGYYRLSWDGRDDSGHSAASGIYFYTLRAGAFSATRQLVLIR